MEPARGTSKKGRWVGFERYLELIVVSGGWAWHFMSPAHDELKHAQDHKDADVFVFPENLWKLLDRLKSDGYEKTWTRFDGVTDLECFSVSIAQDLIARDENPVGHPKMSDYTKFLKKP